MGKAVTSIKVDEQLWKAFKIAAIREDRELWDINSEAIKEWLEKRKYRISP